MKLAMIFVGISATMFLLAEGKYLLVQVEDQEGSLKEVKTNVGIPSIPIPREDFPESTDCEDRLAARSTCGRDHQCMSQRCSPGPLTGKKCARCKGSGGQPCNTECNDDDNCCSNDCTCGNDGIAGSGTRCC